MKTETYIDASLRDNRLTYDDPHVKRIDDPNFCPRVGIIEFLLRLLDLFKGS